MAIWHNVHGEREKQFIWKKREKNPHQNLTTGENTNNYEYTVGRGRSGEGDQITDEQTTAQ